MVATIFVRFSGSLLAFIKDITDGLGNSSADFPRLRRATRVPKRDRHKWLKCNAAWQGE